MQHEGGARCKREGPRWVVRKAITQVSEVSIMHDQRERDYSHEYPPGNTYESGATASAIMCMIQWLYVYY
jgi:hypothetical protein